MKKPSKRGLILCAVVSGFFAIMLLAFVSMELEYLPKVRTSNVNHFEYIDNPVCQYKGCGGEAVRQVEVSFAGSDGRRIRESENYSVNGKSYDKTETGYVPKKDTYLVPTDKGLKVETERGWEEKTYVTGSGTITTVEGYYCAEHEDAGKKLIEDEVKYARISGKTSYWVLGVLAVLPWALLLWSCFKGGKKGAPVKTAEAENPKKP